MQIKRLFSFKNSCIALLFFAAQSVLAANITIQVLPDVPLPTSISPGQTAAAYFIVTNNQFFALNDYQVRGMPGTVVHDTSANNYYNNLPICSNPINLLPGASCLLQLDISDAVPNLYFAICKGNSCTQSPVPLNVTLVPRSTTPRFAYITQYVAGENVIVCAIDPETQLIGNCVNAGGGAAFSLLNAGGIQFNNTGSTAFVTIYFNGSSVPFVYQCPVYANTGMFGACQATEITSPTGFYSSQGFLALNSNSTLAYLPNDNNAGVIACPIAANTIGSTCTDTGVNNGGAAAGITLDSTNSFTFIANYGANVTTCQVNGTSFTQCGNKTGGGLISFSEAFGVAVNNTNTKLYVADNDNFQAIVCDITNLNTTTTTFSSCIYANSVSFGNEPFGIALNATSTMAYLTNGMGGSVYQCPINPSDGTFGTCTTGSNGLLSNTIDIALYY